MCFGKITKAGKNIKSLFFNLDSVKVRILILLLFFLIYLFFKEIGNHVYKTKRYVVFRVVIFPRLT